MAAQLQPMMEELKAEAAITQRVLDRVPPDKLAWKPHAKSMTLGQLALHIATTPGAITRLAQLDEFDVSNANFNPPQPATLAEIQNAFDSSVAAALEYFANAVDADCAATWRLLAGSKELMAVPRMGMLRSILFNHLYHHRGQLSVYLRLLDVKVPVIYGRSADESPFD